jgi:hypothetical protein
VVQTYNPLTGESRDYDSLAELCDETDGRGMSVQADPCRWLPPADPSPLLWIECGQCGADCPFQPDAPCPHCGTPC